MSLAVRTKSGADKWPRAKTNHPSKPKKLKSEKPKGTGSAYQQDKASGKKG